jgi:hypothetical protein
MFIRKLTLRQMAEGDHGGGGGSSSGEGGDAGAGGDNNSSGGEGGDAGNAGEGAGGAGGQGGDAGGQGTPEWLGGLHEDLRGHESLTAFQSVDDLAKKYVELQGQIPKVPESADAYTLTVPEGHKISDKDMAGIRNAFHEAGISDESAGKLFAQVMNDRAKARENQVAAINKMKSDTLASLQKDWGDKSKENIGKADQAVAKVFGESFSKFMRDSGLGNNESFIRGMHKIATAISEDRFVIGNAGGDGRPKDETGRPMLKFKGM